MKGLKEQAFLACENIIRKNLADLQLALAGVTESMESESKSSAGDKHETGRARMQHEHAQIAAQAVQQKLLLEELDKIRHFEQGEGIGHGSLVETSRGFFLIAVPTAKLNVEGVDIQVISPLSPFGKLLLGLQNNSEFSSGNTHYKILGVS
jgi:hypothetical protein